MIHFREDTKLSAPLYLLSQLLYLVSCCFSLTDNKQYVCQKHIAFCLKIELYAVHGSMSRFMTLKFLISFFIKYCFARQK